PYLRALAHRLCRSQLDPDPLVAEVLDKAPPGAAGAGERARLARALYDLFLDKLLSRQAYGGELAETLEFVKPPAGERPWWEGLTEEDVRGQITRLPDEPRAAFELLVLGASHGDIAARLGIEPEAVAARIL